MAPVTVSVVYPMGTKFDMDYYLSTHMPLVQKTWASVGLRNWKVVHYTDPSATYCVQALLDWDSAEAWEKAAGSSEGATVFGDIDNFSDQKPQTLVGEIKGAQTC